MPTNKYAQRTRDRHDALSKKFLDVDLLHESESMPYPGKAPMPDYQTSPTSVASMLAPLLPEMQPIVLPGAWVTVGKKGKPLKSETKMYIDPPKKANKKKKRSRKLRPDDVEPVHALLEEAPSASACLNELARSRLQKEKQSVGGKAIKYWVQRRHDKELAAAARDELRARIDDDGIIGEAADERPSVKQRHTTKVTRTRAIARRHARHESKAARCYWPDEADCDDHPVVEAPRAKVPTARNPARGASKSALAGPSGGGTAPVTMYELSDEWSEPSPVSEKAMQRSPPKSPPKARGHQKKRAKVAAEKDGKSCTVM